jgi:hypothetical protein
VDPPTEADETIITSCNPVLLLDRLPHRQATGQGKRGAAARSVRRHARDRGSLPIVREGIALVVRPAVPVGWHLALFGTYEPELREIFRAVLLPAALRSTSGPTSDGIRARIGPTGGARPPHWSSQNGRARPEARRADGRPAEIHRAAIPRPRM